MGETKQETRVQRTKHAVNTEAFAELYEENLPKVFQYIGYRVGNVQLAEDLTSVVFEKALSKFSSYRSDKASFSTWLLTIARNTVIDHYRVRTSQQTVVLNETVEVADGVSPEEEVVKNEERRRLQVCLTRLSREEQEIISLKFGSELTNRRIAGMLGLSESNVGVKLFRAIGKLRDCFKE